MEGTRCLWFPSSPSLAPGPQGLGVGGGVEGRGQKNDSGRAPGWGEEVPALAGPGGREWRLLVPAAVKGNRDGTIKDSETWFNCTKLYSAYKKKKKSVGVVPPSFLGFEEYCSSLNGGPTQF